MNLRSILLLLLVLAGLLVGGYPVTDAADGLRKPLDLPAGGREMTMKKRTLPRVSTSTGANSKVTPSSLSFLLMDSVVRPTSSTTFVRKSAAL